MPPQHAPRFSEEQVELCVTAQLDFAAKHDLLSTISEHETYIQLKQELINFTLEKELEFFY